MNNTPKKSVQNDRKQSVNCSSEALKNTEYTKIHFSESELYEKIRKLSNTFDSKINQSKQNEHKEEFRASILEEATKSKLTFNKTKLLSHEKACTRLNFLQLLFQNDFSQHFIQKEQDDQQAIKDEISDEFLRNQSSNKSMDSYNESSVLYNIDSFNIKHNCLLSFDNLDTCANKLSFSNQKEAKNETRIDSYEETTALPVFISKKKYLTMNNTDIDDFLFGKRKRKKMQNVDMNAFCKNIDSVNTSSQPERLFPCAICFSTFTSPQGLGGHMSRTHKDQSLKFKRKKEIRESRAAIRDQREEAKRILCENNNKNYYALINSKEGKGTIKKLICQNMKQFKQIRDQLPKTSF